MCFLHPRSKLLLCPLLSRDTFLSCFCHPCESGDVRPGALTVVGGKTFHINQSKKRIVSQTVAFSRAEMASSVTGPRGSHSASRLSLSLLHGGQRAPHHPQTPVLAASPAAAVVAAAASEILQMSLAKKVPGGCKGPSLGHVLIPEAVRVPWAGIPWSFLGPLGPFFGLLW